MTETTEVRRRIGIPDFLRWISVSSLSVACAVGTPYARASHEKAPDENGIAALDVYAQDDKVDLLLAVRKGSDYLLEHRRSVDGGATFSSPVEIKTPDLKVHSPRRGNDPQIASIKDEILVLWTAPGNTKWGSGPLAAARSRDSGKTWSPAAPPAKREPPVGQGYADLVADPKGGVHAVWLDSSDGKQGLRYAKTSDLGNSWSKSATLKSQTCECCWNRIYASPAGSVEVIFRDKEPRDMGLVGSTDRGGKWKKPFHVGTYGWNFKGCPHQGGALAYEPKGPSEKTDRLHALVWTGEEKRPGVHYLRSEDSGKTWKDTQPFSDSGAGHIDLEAAGSRLLATWDTLEDGKKRIKAALSPDSGNSWNAPIVVSGDGVRASHPRVVKTKTGFLVVWTEKAEGKDAGFGSKVIPF